MSEVLTHSYSDQEKELIMTAAMDDANGRLALAQLMVDPIKVALEYQAIGRKLLLVDELPQGVIPRYEKDVYAVASVISKRGAVPESITQGEEVFVPLFEIGVNPQIRLSEIKARRFYIVDRIQMKSKEAIQKLEDTEVLAAINSVVPTSHTVTAAGELTLQALNYVFTTIEEHDLVVAKIVVHPRQYGDFRMFGNEVFDQATRREVLMSGLFGHLYTADIHMSHRVPAGSVYLLAPAETVGAIPIRQDITVLPADNPRELRLGWVIYEEIGVCVINDYATGKVSVTAS
jgi:hypothetical protein